jgi:hypothetical protein
VTAPNKKPFAAEVDLAVGEHRTFDVTLEGQRAIVWPWIVAAGAVVVAGGAVGGYFLFKPTTTLQAPAAGSAAPTVQLMSFHGWSF